MTVYKPKVNKQYNKHPIIIPSKFKFNGSIEQLIEWTYPTLNNVNSPLSAISAFENSAILCPFTGIKNTSQIFRIQQACKQINEKAVTMLCGQSYLMPSTDWTTNNEASAELYSDEVLNTIERSNFPPHKLHLKVFMPVVLLRNYDKKRKLCNGTKLIIIKIDKYMLTLRRAKSPHDIVHLCRWDMYTSENLPFTLGRRQFPIRPAFAFTIHKAQGQSLHRVGVFLPYPVFTHGQLYVALSRATNPDGLKILIIPRCNQGMTQNNDIFTQNIVYDDILHIISNEL